MQIIKTLQEYTHTHTHTHTHGNFKNKKGITLVALVITIIILLILAGITIASLTESGLFKNARLAKEKSENAQKAENLILSGYEDEIEGYLYNSNRNTSDSKSEYIKSFSIEVEPYNTGFKIDTIINITDNSKFFTYHFFAINIENSNDIIAITGNKNEMQIKDLNQGKKYKVFAVAYDIYNNYIYSNEVEKTTLDGYPITENELTTNSYYSIKGSLFRAMNINRKLIKCVLDGTIQNDRKYFSDAKDLAESYYPELSSGLLTKEDFDVLSPEMRKSNPTTYYWLANNTGNSPYNLCNPSGGYYSDGGDGYYMYRIVVSLPNNAKILSGQGTEGDPYIINY